MNTRPSRAARWTAAPLCALRAVTLTVLCLAPVPRLLANPDANLGLAITRALRPIGPVTVLTWTSVPGASYVVQYRTTLVGPAAWQDFELVTATGARSSSEVPLALIGSGAPREGFYRLVLPPPTITGLEPALLNVAGGQLFVTGQCFAPGDVVRINGVDLPTNFIDPTLLSATVSGFAPGIYDVQIVRGGRVIATLTDALTVTNGLPIETLEPPSLPPGAPANLEMNSWLEAAQAGRVAGGSAEVDDEVLVMFLHGDAGGSGEVVAFSVDLAIPGRGLDFIWATTYRSRNGETATMGNNWTHSYDIRVAQSGADLLVRDGTGRRDTYFLQGDGSFARRGFFRRGTLAGNVFTLEFADKGRWIFNPLNGSPSAGKIAQSIDRNGNALQFSYDGLGRLAVIVDTLGRTYQVQYDPNGRVGALIDFSGRSVVYNYYGTGNPLGANGMLRTIRSPLVTGTPTGNDFPSGKTQTFTYSVGFSNTLLNDNLLTVTDPRGQTCARFTYSPTTNALDVTFDRDVSVRLGNPADAIDQPAVFTWLEQTPSPANGFARLKLIANDPVGNVRETFFDSRNLPVDQLEYTGRAIPGVAVTETANRPTGQPRPSDPQFFETQAQWNLNFLPTRITLPRTNALAYDWETDFNPTATARESGNLRTLRQIGLASETLVWRMEHEPGFGSVEQSFVSRLMEEEGIFYSLEGDPDQPIITGSVPNSRAEMVPKMWPGVVQRISQGPRVFNPVPNPIRLLDTRSQLKDTDGLITFWDLNDSHIAGDWPDAVPYHPLPKPGVYRIAASWPSFHPLSAPVRLLDQRPMESNKLYVGGLSWDSPSEGGRPDPYTFANDGRGGGLNHPDLYLNVWSHQAELPRKPHPDFLWWPSGKPSPDSSSFPRAVTNPRGHTTTATYDNAGNCTQSQSPLSGTVDTFSYNGSGQLTSHVHPANGSGSQRNDTFSYYNGGPQNGYLADAIVDAGGLGLTTHFEYNARGHVVRVVDPRGNDTLLTRNQLDEVVRASSPTVNGARNEHDFIYDANDNVVRIDVQNRDENGALGANTHFSRTWSYDFRNFPTQRADEINATTTRSIQFAYDGNRNLALLTLPEAASGADRSNIVRVQYDERDLPFRTIGAAGAAVQSTTQFDYDANGSLLQRSQGLESAPRLTRYSYDGFDRPIGLLDAGGNTAALIRDGMGNVTRVEIMGNAEPLPAPTRQLFTADYSYNELNRLTSSRLGFFNLVTGIPFGDGTRTTTAVRAPNQQLTMMTDDNNRTTSFGYDTANRVVRTTDARGNATDVTRDANGNVTIAQLTDKRDSGAPDEQFRITCIYDALNRRASAHDNVGNLTTYRYDSRSNLTRLIDARGTDTIHTYDGLSRRIRSVEDMDGSGTETTPDITHIFQYDDDSRLTRMTDDNGNITRYTYDSLNRPIATEQADSTQNGWTYDVHHNRISSLDANGTAVTYTYDLLNRLTRRDIVPGGGVATTTTFEEFFYDGMSRTLRAVNDGSTVNFIYDSLSNLRSESLGALTTSSTYDAVGNRLSLTYPGGRVLTYTYDAINRRTRVVDGTLTLGSFLYAGRDRLERANFGNGTRIDVTYDGQIGGPTIIGDFGWRRPVLVSHTKVAGGAVFDSRAMTWDRNQNKITRNRPTPFVAGGPTQTRLFDYDADDRLIHSNVALSSGPMLDTQYQLDGESNRLQVIGGLNPGAYTRDPTTPVPADFQVDQYTTTPFDARQYDENGNLRLTNPTGPNGVSRFMMFDYANRLVSAQLAGGLQAQYRYDALGRRIQRDIQPPGPPVIVTTRFIYDGASVIEERDGAGTLLASYDNGRMAGPSGWQEDFVIRGNCGEKSEIWWFTVMHRGGQDNWLHPDDAGNTLALTNATGAVVERYDYDDYGEVQFLDPAGAPIAGATQSVAGNPYLFRGLRYEPELRFFLLGGTAGKSPEYHKVWEDAAFGIYWDPQAARFTTKGAKGGAHVGGMQVGLGDGSVRFFLGGVRVASEDLD